MLANQHAMAQMDMLDEKIGGTNLGREDLSMRKEIPGSQ